MRVTAVLLCFDMDGQTTSPVGPQLPSAAAGSAQPVLLVPQVSVGPGLQQMLGMMQTQQSLQLLVQKQEEDERRRKQHEAASAIVANPFDGHTAGSPTLVVWSTFSVVSRVEAIAVRDAALALHTKASQYKRPLDAVRFLEDEFGKCDQKLHRFPELKVGNSDRHTVLLQSLSSECRQYIVLHGRSDTWESLCAHNPQVISLLTKSPEYRSRSESRVQRFWN